MLAWLPVNILNCVTFFHGGDLVFPHELLLAAIVLSHANSTLNPLIYAVSNSQIKGAMLNVVCRKPCGAQEEVLEASSDNKRTPSQHDSSEQLEQPDKGSSLKRIWATNTGFYNVAHTADTT